MIDATDTMALRGLVDTAPTIRFPRPLDDRRRAAADQQGFGPLIRLVIAGSSLGALLLWAIGEFSGVSGFRTVAGTWYCCVGIGAAGWNLMPRLPVATRIALTGLTSFAVLTIGSSVMLAAGVWWPRQVMLGVVLVTLPAHVVGCWLAARDLAAAGSPMAELQGTRTAIALGLAFSGGVLCFGSSLAHRHLDPGFWGFLPRIGGAWYLGFGLVLLSVVVSRSSRQAVMAICVLTLLLVTVGTPALVYDGPRSQSAAKHVDLVEQIRTFHQLASSIKVYNAWPGFFGAMAWICDGCGIRDPMALATAWPLLIGGLRLAALRFLAGAVTNDARTAWTAVTLAVLADPIGADYFSPQSVGFVLGLIGFGFALRRTASLVPQWCAKSAIGLVGCTLAISHQLSPYLVGGVLCLLVVFGQARPVWMPLLVLGPAIGWLVCHRGALQGFVSFDEIGRFYNFRPPPTPTAPGLTRLAIVAETSAALALGIVIIGMLALCVLVRDHRDPRTWAIAICPAVGLAFVVVNPYGNEGIFRASLFGIPWLAVLAAKMFGGPRTRALEISFGALTCALTVTFLTAAFGLDGTNVLRHSDLAAFEYLRDRTIGTTGRQPLVLDLGIGDLPASPPGPWGNFVLIRRGELHEPIPEAGNQPPASTMATLTHRLIEYSGVAPGQATLYALWSPVSMRYAWAYGVVRPTSFRALRNAFSDSGYWTVVREERGTLLFRFDASRYPRASS